MSFTFDQATGSVCHLPRVPVRRPKTMTATKKPDQSRNLFNQPGMLTPAVYGACHDAPRPWRARLVHAGRVAVQQLADEPLAARLAGIARDLLQQRSVVGTQLVHVGLDLAVFL